MAVHDPWGSFQNQRDDIEPVEDDIELEIPATLGQKVIGSLIFGVMLIAIFAILGELTLELFLVFIVLGILSYLFS